jgi:hypothetical protein
MNSQIEDQELQCIDFLEGCVVCNKNLSVPIRDIQLPIQAVSKSDTNTQVNSSTDFIQNLTSTDSPKLGFNPNEVSENSNEWKIANEIAQTFFDKDFIPDYNWKQW